MKKLKVKMSQYLVNRNNKRSQYLVKQDKQKKDEPKMKMSHNVSINRKPNDNQPNLKMSQLLVNRMKNRTKNMRKKRNYG